MPHRKDQTSQLDPVGDLAFFLESLVSKIINFLDIVNVLFTLVLGMVVNLERSL